MSSSAGLYGPARWYLHYCLAVVERIEEATSDDRDVVVELQGLLFAEDAGVHDPHAEIGWPAQHGAEDFRELMDNPDAVVLLARSEDQVCGLVIGYASKSGPTRQPILVGVLRTMYVRGEDRGQGFGGQLTDAFLQWARTHGCQEVQVSSYFQNAAARRLYERAGFIPQSVSHIQQLNP